MTGLSAMNESYRAVVSGIEKFHADKLILRLKPERPFPFQAGQYVELTLETCEPRYYSIACTPGSADIELHIKDNGNGGLGTYAMTKLQIGDSASIRGPFGNCTWRDDGKPHQILVAGGIGIIPLKAITEAAIASSYAGRLSLYWGVQQQADLYLQSQFDALEKQVANFSFHPVVADPLHDLIRKNEADLSRARIYISGPPAMFASLVPALLAQHADPAGFRSDNQDLVSALVKEYMAGTLRPSGT